jgi:hypothetical protein
MTRQSKTKLIKLVCKRAELMRAPFRGSSSTNKISQTDKKSSFRNQTEEKLRSIKSSTTKCRENMANNSEGMYYRKIYSTFKNSFLHFSKQEWIIIKSVQTESIMFLWTRKCEVRYIFQKKKEKKYNHIRQLLFTNISTINLQQRRFRYSLSSFL